MAGRVPKVIAALALLFGGGGAAAQSAPDIPRGRYLVSIMDCGTCHTDGAFLGKPDLAHPLAGSSVAHEVGGLGIFWPPNLTPDRATGLGAWSDRDIVKALRTGVRPDGRVLAPAMPWTSYAHLTDADAFAIAHFLQSLPPTAAVVRPAAPAGTAPATPVNTIIMPAADKIP
jgi:mono/diheme cytochrome c family protein